MSEFFNVNRSYDITNIHLLNSSSADLLISENDDRAQVPYAPKDFVWSNEEEKWKGVRYFFTENFFHTRTKVDLDSDLGFISKRCDIYSLYDIYCKITRKTIDMSEAENSDTFAKLFIRQLYDNAFINNSQIDKDFLLNIFEEYYPYIYDDVNKKPVLNDLNIHSMAMSLRDKQLRYLEAYDPYETAMSFIMVCGRLLGKEFEGNDAFYGINFIHGEHIKCIDENKAKIVEKHRDLEKAGNKNISEDVVTDILDNIPKNYYRKERLKIDPNFYSLIYYILNDYNFDMDTLLNTCYGDIRIDDRLSMLNAIQYMTVFMDKDEIKNLSRQELGVYRVITILTLAFAEKSYEYQQAISTFVSENSTKSIRNIRKNITLNKGYSLDEDTPAPLPKEEPIQKEEAVIEAPNDYEDRLNEAYKEIERLKKEKETLSVSYSELKAEINTLKNDIDASNELINDKDKEIDMLKSLLDKKVESNVNDIQIDMILPEICHKSITIVGGNTNMIKKMKTILPGWKYLGDKTLSSGNEKVLFSSEKIYFLSDHISHSLFYKYYNVIKEHKLDYGYIHVTSLDLLIRQVYSDLVA